MSYKALYRTYRPSTFNDVAGQRAIVQTLQNALNQNKIAHAYLFSGPRGTGKTSMAKLFAKALNCEEGLGKQCNKCQNCLGVNDGSHPDVIEIDAASNNGVEDVRQLIENVNYSPIRGKYKVYIIDEVHMMTQSAFNALLKTLEEPPKNVIFILATTEPHKVIATILSRCQRYNFSKVSDIDISKRLQTILMAENIDFELDALTLLVSLADGGVRDALSMLDQVLAYSGNKLRTDDVLSLFALTSKLEQIKLLQAIAANEVKTVFTITNSLSEKGVDIKRLTMDLLNILKDVLIFYKTRAFDLLLTLREHEAEELVDVFTVTEINNMIDLFLKAQTEYRFASDIKNIFELTLLKILTNLTHGPELSEVKQQIKFDALPKVEPKGKGPTLKPVQAKQEIEELPPFMTQDTVETKVEPVNPSAKVEVTVPTKQIVINELHEEGTPIVLSEDVLIKAMTLGDRDERRKLKDELWENELSLLAFDVDLGAYAQLLINGTPYLLTKELLVLEFNFESYVANCNLKENQHNLQTIITKMLGRKVVVYGVYTETQRALTKRFRQLSQLSKLPKVKNLTKDLEGVF